MSNYKPEGILKQERFLNDIHSRPLVCPSCKGTHTYIELRGGNDWTKGPERIFCPNTKQELSHNVALIGGEYSLSIVDNGRRICTMQRLKELAANEEGLDCFILLTAGLRSSKHVIFYPDDQEFFITNDIDGTEQELTEPRLFTESNIGEALTGGNLYITQWEESKLDATV